MEKTPEEESLMEDGGIDDRQMNGWKKVVISQLVIERVFFMKKKTLPKMPAKKTTTNWTVSRARLQGAY